MYISSRRHVIPLFMILTCWLVGAVAGCSRSNPPPLLSTSPAESDPAQEQKDDTDTTVKKRIRASRAAAKALSREARKLEPFVKTDWVRGFLSATQYLPAVTPRKLYYDRSGGKVYSEREVQALGEEERAKLEKHTRHGGFYYNSKHGSPLAYCRALDVLGAEGFKLRPGVKIADYGYGSIGQLRLLASLGAEVVGIEVDPELRALYSEPGDQGPIQGAKGVTGTLRLLHGLFPSDEELMRSMGKGYDLFMSKNVLKNGYIHPARPPGSPPLLDLGVEEQAFVQTMYDLLNPGGYVLIYNICPPEAAPDETYIPWADGHSPFSIEMYESVGFRVLVFDRDDTQATRGMARLLGWEEKAQAMGVSKDLFAWYTIVRKPDA